jgi:hypothetical protein
MRLAAGLISLTMLNTPAAWPQNPAPATAQDPAPAAQSPGSAAPATGQQAAPAAEYPLLPGNGAPDAMPRRYITMWNTGDFRLLDGMFVPQPTLHYPIFPGLAMPPSMVVGRINAWRNCMPDFNYQILDTIVQGNKVVLRLVYTGTYEKRCYTDIPGPVAGAPPVKIHVNEVLIFGLDHGQISDIWEQDDELRARLQMGAKWCNKKEAATAPPQPPPAASPNPTPPSASPSTP